LTHVLYGHGVNSNLTEYKLNHPTINFLKFGELKSLLNKVLKKMFSSYSLKSVILI